jgi:hypothetical protein
LKVRVSLRRSPRVPGVRTQTVTQSLPTSRPTTRAEHGLHRVLLSREAPRARRRRPGGTSAWTQTACSLATNSAAIEAARHTSPRAHPHLCVSTPPADTVISPASAAIPQIPSPIHLFHSGSRGAGW